MENQSRQWAENNYERIKKAFEQKPYDVSVAINYDDNAFDFDGKTGAAQIKFEILQDLFVIRGFDATVEELAERIK